MSKNVVFDVVGTLVGHEYLFEAIEKRLGADKLHAHNINGKLLGACWIETAEREYTYLSLSGRYAPFYVIFAELFYRMLTYAGIEDPHSFATPDDVAYLVDAYRSLALRPGAAECIQKLQDAGFTVWYFTAADLNRVNGYFAKAGITLPAESLVSCDSNGVAKPQPEAYQPLLKKLSAEGGKPWFAAAHMWDVSAARTTGFRGAYCSILELEPLHQIFGDMDVVADTLPAMADKIIAATE